MPEFKFSASFKVYGSCPACKERIESTLIELKGIYSAKWEIENQYLLLVYENKTISINEIHRVINSIGYDTEDHKTTSEAYNSLPESCRHFGNFLNKISI